VVEATMAHITRETASLHQAVAGAAQLQLDGLAQRFEATTTDVATRLTSGWQAALSEHQQASRELSAETRDALTKAAIAFGQQAGSLVQTVDAAHTRLREDLAEQDAQRQSTWQQSLTATAGTLQQQWQSGHAEAVARQREIHDAMQRQWREANAETLARQRETHEALQQQWQQAGAEALAQQRAIVETLEKTAGSITTQADAHARETIAEVARLMQAASQAPRVAAEVIAEMRQKVSDSVARDTAALDERNRLMETLGTLLDAVNRASNEQRGAIDALIESTASVLDRVGTQFTDKASAETDKLTAVAAQVTGSAVEVASLGDAFGVAVQLFSQSSDKLMEQLKRVEASLTQSISRSDEQLAYYVAQARELIDLSVMSQKQIIDDLQQLAAHRRADLADA
jgi:hypothetical protein